VTAATRARAQFAAENDESGRVVRFDAVHALHVACNLRRIVDRIHDRG
jgi:glutathionyl-hydroquinone reductase